MGFVQLGSAETSEIMKLPRTRCFLTLFRLKSPAQNDKIQNEDKTHQMAAEHFDFVVVKSSRSNSGPCPWHGMALVAVAVAVGNKKKPCHALHRMT